MTKPRCYLDVEIDNEPAGRIVVELFNDICPITCENFRALCTGEKGLGQVTKKPLWYKNTLFHRVVKNFVIQSGDFEAGNGTGGESIYGGQFTDENFILSHDKPFLLSMANKGKNTNGSQFFITLQASPHLDKLHTVFGHVISGHEVIKQIENIKTDQNSKPLKEVKIAQCGELVLRSEKRKKRKESTSESSSSEEERRKKKKKHKKEKKKSKKEKKSKGFYSSSNKAEDDIACNVDPDEIPAIPANVFLMRRTSPVTEFRRTPRGRENYQFKRGPPSRTRSGRKVKGRGNMRYRTPSSSDERSGSETPPHWKQAQSRLKKLKEVIKEKDKNSDSELSNGEDDENKSLQNPFLHSRLGLVSSRNFDDERRREKDARMNINESRRRKDYSQDSRHNRDNDEPENLFEKLMQEDQIHGNSWFDGNNQDQSDEEAHSSPLRSKIVVKSSVSQRDSRSNRRGDERDNYRNDERDNYRGDERDNFRNNERNNCRRYNESRRRDSPSDKRSRTYHRDSSSGHDNSYKKSDHHSENKKETNKNSNEKKNEKPKELSRKSQKRLNLLENDLFRYTKQEPIITPKNKNTPISETKEENPKKNEEVILQNSVSSVPNSNLAALKEYESKSNEKCGHESNDNAQIKLFTCESEKDKHKTEDIVSETVSVISSVKNHESQQSDSPLMQNVVDHKLDEELENNFPSTKTSSNSHQSENVSIPIPGEELGSGEKDRALSNNFHLSENKIKEKIDEKSEHKFKHSENEGGKLINNEEQNDYNHPEIIPLPDERENDKNAKDILVKKTNETEMQATREKEMESQSSVQVAENSSDSPETPREFQSKGKKIKQENRKETSPQIRSPSPSEEIRKSHKKVHKRMSVSPPRSESPSHHKIVKRRISKSPDNQKASSSKQSHSPYSRRSKSPVNRAKSPISRRKRSSIRKSKSRSRSRSVHRSTSRNRGHRKYSRSPEVRPRRSHTRSHSRSRNVGRGNRSYRQSGVRNRSPELRSSFQRRNKSPFRGRARGRSASRRSDTRSRSRSVDKRRRRRRQVSSSSSSSSSSSRSDNIKRRNKKSSGIKSRNRRSSSSSSSSSASSRSKRSNS